jgi:hypothetical protein
VIFIDAVEVPFILTPPNPVAEADGSLVYSIFNRDLNGV